VLEMNTDAVYVTGAKPLFNISR